MRNLRCGAEPRSPGEVQPVAMRVLACDTALRPGLRDPLFRSSPGASGKLSGTVPYVRAPDARSVPRTAEGFGIGVSLLNSPVQFS